MEKKFLLAEQTQIDACRCLLNHVLHQLNDVYTLPAASLVYDAALHGTFIKTQ